MVSRNALLPRFRAWLSRLPERLRHWFTGPEGVALQCASVACAGNIAVVYLTRDVWAGLVTLGTAAVVLAVKRAARRRWQHRIMAAGWAAGVRDGLTAARNEAPPAALRAAIAAAEATPMRRDLN